MANFFSRLLNIFRGKTNTVLEKFENPEEQLTVFVEDLNKHMASQQKSVAAAIADEKRLKLQMEELSDKANQWERKAVLALEAGDEGLAKEALLQKEECDQHKSVTMKSWQTQKEATEKLKSSLVLSKEKVEDAKRKYNLLVARYKSAKANQQITQTLSAKADNSPLELMDKLNDRILKIESETEANIELIGDSSSSDIEAKFIQLEKRSRGDQALLQLKEKLANKDSGSLLEDKVSSLKSKLGQK
jgi:phage shock protein A